MSDNVSHQSLIELLKGSLKEMSVDGLSGGISAWFTNLLFHPLENIRTRLQDYEASEDDEEDIESVS